TVPSGPSPAVLRSWLADQLPDYMVPTAFLALDALPLTPNGKLDRSALPDPEPQSGAEHVPPRTPVEGALAEIWMGVLGVDRVGVLDNFFDLGGDSILSIQVISRARRAGLGLATKDLFLHQTIESLARVVTEVAAGPGEPAMVSGALPLTPIQRWFFETH